MRAPSWRRRTCSHSDPESATKEVQVQGRHKGRGGANDRERSELNGVFSGLSVHVSEALRHEDNLEAAEGACLLAFSMPSGSPMCPDARGGRGGQQEEEMQTNSSSSHVVGVHTSSPTPQNSMNVICYTILFL